MKRPILRKTVNGFPYSNQTTSVIDYLYSGYGIPMYSITGEPIVVETLTLPNLLKDIEDYKEHPEIEYIERRVLTFHFDLDAEDNGDGSLEHPFNNMNTAENTIRQIPFINNTSLRTGSQHNDAYKCFHQIKNVGRTFTSSDPSVSLSYGHILNNFSIYSASIGRCMLINSDLSNASNITAGIIYNCSATASIVYGTTERDNVSIDAEIIVDCSFDFNMLTTTYLGKCEVDSRVWINVSYDYYYKRPDFSGTSGETINLFSGMTCINCNGNITYDYPGLYYGSYRINAFSYLQHAFHCSGNANIIPNTGFYGTIEENEFYKVDEIY